MIRYLGMGCVFFAAFAFVRRFERGRTQRLRDEEACLRLLEALLRELSSYGRPLSRFAASYEDPSAAVMPLIARLREGAALSDALHAVREQTQVSEPFWRILTAYAATFGDVPLSVERQRLSGVIDELRCMVRATGEEHGRLVRLVRTLSASASLAVVLLLL